MSVYFFIGGLILCILEVVVPGFVLLPIGVGFVMGGLTSYFFELPILWQWIVVSAYLSISWVAFRKLAQKTKRQQIPSNMDALIGREGVIVEPFDAKARLAYVRVYGDEWRVIWSENIELNVGDRVRILSHQGSSVHIERKGESNGV